MKTQPIERISSAATISRYQRAFGIDMALISQKSGDAAANPRLREIHILHRDARDPLQRMLNALQPDSYIRPHRHSTPPKAELVILLGGSLGFVTFLDDGTPDDFIHLSPATALAADCREGIWHTFFALEPNAVVLEVKAGPHDPLKDREFAPWAPDETSVDTLRYLENLKSYFH